MTRRGSSWLTATIRRFPTTLGLTGVVVAVGVVTSRHSYAHHQETLRWIGIDLDLLRLDHLWALPVATVVQSSPGLRWHMLLLVAWSLALLEYLAGSLRALITFLLTDWISSPLTVLALYCLAHLGSSQALQTLHIPDAGSSAATHGALGAAFAVLPKRWSDLALCGFFAYGVAALSFQRIDAALAHLLASLIGATVGWVVWRPHVSAVVADDRH